MFIEVRLSSLRVRQPRRFGDCWAACRLWQQLGLDVFWREALSGARGLEPWEKVLELLASLREVQAEALSTRLIQNFDELFGPEPESRTPVKNFRP